MMDMEPKSKMESLLELVKEMKRLQGEQAAGKPHSMEIELHAQKVDPKDMEHMEEMTHTDLDHDNEEGESPEHKAMVMGDESEECPPEHEEQDEMQIPEGLMKLLAERLHK